jgi:hypothetical protein
MGQAYNGTVVALIAGLLGLGSAAFAMVVWAERGRLFGVNEGAEDSKAQV